MIKDTKNWTWVLERRCEECGFDASAVGRTHLGPLALRAAHDLRRALAGPSVTVRPSGQVWSPLEYGCHVRDVFAIFHERLSRMLTEENPTFANWDQDETAVSERYGEQDPAVVSVALVHNAERLASAFAEVTEWDRTGRRSDGAEFTVLTLGQYLVHDPVHHVWDVTQTQQT
jgi:hypothetical protein